MGPSVNAKLNKKLRLDFDYQVRLNQKLTSYKHSFTQFGLQVKLKKWLYLKPSYRMVFAPLVNSNRHRLAVDIAFKLRKKKIPFELNNRIRTQYATSINKRDFDLVLRNRLTLIYTGSKLLEPSLSFEGFAPLLELDAWRLKMDLNWRLTKQLSLTTFYGLEKEVGKKTPDTVHIFGVKGTLRFKVKKRLAINQNIPKKGGSDERP